MDKYTVDGKIFNAEDFVKHAQAYQPDLVKKTADKLGEVVKEMYDTAEYILRDRGHIVEKINNRS